MSPETTQQAFALAFEHHRAGRWAQAEALYRQILAAQPEHAEAWHFLGVIAIQAGQPDRALPLIRQALALQPDNPAAHTNLGEACRRLGRVDEAIAHFRRSCEMKPRSPEAHYNLGTALSEAGQREEAVTALRRALELRPDYPEACNNLGNVLQALDRSEEAVAEFHRALQLQPQMPEAHNNLAAAHAKLGQWREAAAEYQRALALRPDYPDARYNLANALRDCGRLDEAIEEYGRVLQQAPRSADALCNLGVALSNRGQAGEGMVYFKKAIDAETSAPRYLSNLIYALQFLPDGGGARMREEKTLWNRRFVAPLRSTWARFENVPDPRRRLRIGYVSPSFHANAVAFFLVPLLEAHDHGSCEVYCYASVRRPDAVTARLRKCADGWRDVRTWSDAQLAECIRRDGIDILVDLAMHAGDNRLALFAHKPAPVQVSWLAYPGSTGMEAIDYRLTDACLEPPGEAVEAPGEKLDAFGEKPVRLPDAWCCYEPIEEFPPVGPLPAMTRGGVTFGSLNQFNKINEDLLRCWAKLLAAVTDSRLVMICPEGQAQARTREVFAARGITPERIECIAQRPWREYAELFTKIDIALDAFPHNGMTTTCHTLWMGVPVVTRTGATPVSRAGSSLLHAVGLPEWVANDEEQYVRIATDWAADLPRLAELRGSLRDRMQASPLMDAPRFASNVEAAYRGMWQSWCAEHPSSIP